MKKIAIVTSGGGITCAYSAGAILALVERFNLVEPYLVIGSSASTGTLAYYVAGQYTYLRNVWENLIPSKKLISLLRLNKIVDIDYLIDDIFKKQATIDVNKIKVSKIKFFISATNSETGDLEYFGNQKDVDIFEALRASIAGPIAYNKTVKINDHTYIDGAISAFQSVNIEKAKQEGADVVIVIDNSSQNATSDILFGLYSVFKPKSFREQVKNYFKQKTYQNDDKQVLLIKPSIKLPVGLLDNRRDDIIEAMQIGYNDVVNKFDLIQKLLFD